MLYNFVYHYVCCMLYHSSFKVLVVFVFCMLYYLFDSSFRVPQVAPQPGQGSILPAGDREGTLRVGLIICVNIYTYIYI